MKTQAIKKGTSKLNDLEFKNRVEFITSSMSGNVNFPTPVVPLADVRVKTIRFGEVLELIKNGEGTRSIEVEKDGLRTDLQTDVDRLFSYVNGVSTSIDILVSSGFPLAKERKPIGDLPMPSDFKVRSLTSGTARTSAKSVHGADGYLYQYMVSPSPEVENWINIYETRCRITIGNLQSGTQYKFRMCAIGAKGQGEWSNAITCYIS